MSNNDVELKILHKNINDKTELLYHDVISTARKAFTLLAKNQVKNTGAFKKWLDNSKASLQDKYSSHLYNSPRP